MFTGKLKLTAGISIAIIIAGVICGIVFGGLNLGIDFTGGSLITIDIKEDFDADVIHDVLAQHDASDAPIVKTGDNYRSVEIRMRDVPTDQDETEVVAAIVSDIQQAYPNAELGSIDHVGGTASADLVRNAILAIVIASALMLLYIWIRFELYSGIAAIVTLLQDVLVMIAVMAIAQVQLNSGFIAAVLTIVGYSINNTIVIFDRIRDNKKVLKTKGLTRNELADTSIKETLGRTINTSVTTLIMIVALYIFGVDAVKEFALPIIVGLLAGVYSSVFLSAPIWALLADAADKRKAAAKTGNGKKKANGKNGNGKNGGKQKKAAKA